MFDPHKISSRWGWMAPAVLLIMVLGPGCSEDTTVPVDEGPTVPDTGVLLSGSAGSPAVEALQDFGPIPAPPEEVVNGFFASRLTAVLDQAATVGEVNGFLTAKGALIVSMSKGDPLLTLEVPFMAGEPEALVQTEAMVASEAFIYAQAEFAPYGKGAQKTTGRAIQGEKVLPPSGQAGTEHLEKMRVLPAWNARRLVVSNGSQVGAYVVDYFANAREHPQISSQFFLTTQGTSSYAGNDGFINAGIIAADFDETVPTGVHPGPASALRTYCYPIDGLTWPDLVRVSLPRNLEEVCVISIPLEYGEGSGRTRFQMVIDAMRVRLLNIEKENLICVYAGTANPEFESPWTLATYLVDDLDSLLDRDQLVAPQRALLDNYTDLLQRVGVGIPGNFMIVGASDYEGNELTVQAPTARASFLATGPCVMPDGECDGSVATVEDGWVAVPQVAGLSAYLWSLKPELKAEDLIQIVHTAFYQSATPGFVDAYDAALALDSTLAEAHVRGAILDVTDQTGILGNPDGQFDEFDIKVFLDAQSPPQIHSRLDLNGDGMTGPSKARMDLNVDLVPSYGTEIQIVRDNCPLSFDENAVSDIDALIYYAYSALFTGDPGERDDLLDPYLPVGCPNGEEIVTQWAGTHLNFDYGTCDSCIPEDVVATTIQNGTSLTFLYGEKNQNGTCPEYPGDAEIFMITTVPENWTGFAGVGIRPDYNICEARPGQDGLAVTASLSGDTLRGTVYYQNNCTNGCYYQFALIRQ